MNNETSGVKKWDSLYMKGRQGKYPYEMLIRFINSKFPQESRADSKVLDLGFGTGRHLIYLAEEGFQTYGIEHSIAAVEIAKDWLAEKGLKANLKVGSVLDCPLWGEEFDAVIDISCIQHNSYGDMEKIISNVHQVLKPGGYCFSVIKTEYDSLRQTGTKLEGITYEFPAGIDKIGNSTIISFASLKDVTELYSGFSKLQIEKEDWSYDNMKKIVSHWIIVAQK